MGIAMSYHECDDYNEYEAPTHVHLLIATGNEDSDKERWVAKVFISEYEATKEAEKRNAAIAASYVAFNKYETSQDVLRTYLSEPYLVAEGRSMIPDQRYDHLTNHDKKLVDREIEKAIGPEPEHSKATYYTIVSLPIEECGEWELP